MKEAATRDFGDLQKRRGGGETENMNIMYQKLNTLNLSRTESNIRNMVYQSQREENRPSVEGVEDRIWHDDADSKKRSVTTANSKVTWVIDVRRSRNGEHSIMYEKSPPKKQNTKTVKPFPVTVLIKTNFDL